MSEPDGRPRASGLTAPGLEGEARPARAAELTGYALAALAATSWGAQSVVAKILLLTSGFPAGTLVSVRTMLSALVIVAALAVLQPRALRVSPRDAVRLAILGLGGMALSNYTYYLTLTRIPVAMAALLIYAAPLFVVAASVLLLGQRLRGAEILAVLVTLGGAALVVRVYEPSALRLSAAGLTFGILSALGFAFYNLWARTLPPGIPPWTVLAYSFAAAALCYLPGAPPWDLLGQSRPPAVWLGVGVVTVFGMLVPFALYLLALRRIGAAHASVTSTLEPVVSGAVAFLVLGETLAWPQLAGGALVLLGIALLQLRS